MELATLKIEVKAWERAFRARENRAPTKEDIRKDPHGIGEKYALYRKLVKEQSGASSSSHAPSSSRTASSSAQVSSGARPSRQTPRTIPSSEYPTTPTPHSRRSSSVTKSNASAKTLDYGEAPVSRPAKRALPSSPSQPPSASRSFITPKKPRPSYSGPIHDPNPINPFSSPVRSASSRSLFVPAPAPAQATGESPFLHANSPRKLKELLEANSLRKMKARSGVSEKGDGVEEITPRSKARLRLAGDFITPMKEKVPARKRGQAKVEEPTIGKRSMQMEDEMNGGAPSDDDDEFGPSPMKAGPSRTFTELLQAADDRPAPRNGMNGKKRPLQTGSARPGTRDTSASITNFFSKQPKAKVKLQPEEPEEERKQVEDTLNHTERRKPNPNDEDAILQDVLGAGAEDEADIEDDVERLSTPPPDTLLEKPLPFSPPPSGRVTKIVEFSDDEVDEWDPEGANVRRKVVITGTRRNVQRRESLSSGGESGDEGLDTVAEPDQDLNDGDQENAAHGVDFIDDDDSIPPLTADSTTPTHSSPRSTTLPQPIPLLSLLSLRSPPRKSHKMTDLRVRAIFNPQDAALLAAVKRGQDVRASGEGDEATEEDLLERLDGGVVDEVGDEGDDDWEEECEGWKGTPLGMDDEEW